MGLQGCGAGVWVCGGLGLDGGGRELMVLYTVQYICRGLRQPHQSNITCLTYVPNFLVIIQKIISF